MNLIELKNTCPYLYNFYKALHEDCVWGKKSFEEFSEAVMSFANYDKIPDRLREFELLTDTYEYFLKTHSNKEWVNGTYKLPIEKFYTMGIVFYDDSIYINFLNTLLRKRKISNILNADILSFDEHYNTLLNTLYLESVKFLDNGINEKEFKNYTFTCIKRAFYNNDSDQYRLLTGLDTILSYDKIFNHFYTQYKKTNDIFIFRELKFFTDVYPKLKDSVNNYIRLHKIKSLIK